jgi:hypothetical protein
VTVVGEDWTLQLPGHELSKPSEWIVTVWLPLPPPPELLSVAIIAAPEPLIG